MINKQLLIKLLIFALVGTVFEVLALYTYGLAEEVTIYDLPAPSKEQWQSVAIRSEDQRQKGQKGGEMGQNAQFIAICESDPNAMAIAIDLGGIYTSYDGGKNWKLSRKGIYANGCQGVAFDPMNKHILFAVGSKSSASAAEKAGDLRNKPFTEDLYSPEVDGIYLSENDGQDWRLVLKAGHARNKAQHNYFAFDTSSFDGTRCMTIYAGTHTIGLVKSTDGGGTWNSIGLSGLKIESINFHPTNRNIIYVATYEGLFKSANGGETFTAIAGLPNEILWGFDLSKKNPENLFSAFGNSGVYMSTNSGNTFTKLSTLSTHDYRRIACSPVDSNIVFLDGNSIVSKPYYSWNGGNTWSSFSSADGGIYDPNALAWYSDSLTAHPNNSLTVFTTRPVHKSVDGGKTWKYLSDGISGLRLTTRTGIAFSQNPNVTGFAFGDVGLFITKNNCNSFDYLNLERYDNGLTTPVLAWEPVQDSKKILTAVGSWSKQILRISNDAGKTWADVKNTPIGLWRSLFFHKQKPNIIYGHVQSDMERGLKSEDGGGTWRTLDYTVMAVSSKNGDVIWGTDTTRKIIYKSQDTGKTWTKIKDFTYQVLSLDCDPTGNKIFVAEDYKGISIYDGNIWFSPGEKEGITKDIFGETRFYCIAVDQSHPEVVYAGQLNSYKGRAAGLFRSTDSGRTWKNISYTLDPLNVWMVTVSPHDGTVYIGTDNGTYRMACPISPITNPSSLRLKPVTP